MSDIVNEKAAAKQAVQHLDCSDTWRAAVVMAVKIGVLQAVLGQPAMSEKQLVKALADAMGGFGYRRFHASALRRAYGAGRIGVERVAEAKAKGW